MASNRTALAALTVIVAVLAGCSAPAPAPDEDRSSFLGGAALPSSEATISPDPESYAHVDVPDGYRVVAIRAADDPTAGIVLAALNAWGAENGVQIEERTGADPDEVETQIIAATEAAPDLIVGAGAGVVDVFALVTSSFLDQEFLVVGAKLAEPTENVTAVVWPGAGFRGTGITPEADDDPAAVTPERAREAVKAGYASIRLGITGIVVSLP